MWLKISNPYVTGFVAADEVIFIGESQKDGIYVKLRSSGMTGEGVTLDPAYISAANVAEMIQNYFEEDDE